MLECISRRAEGETANPAKHRQFSNADLANPDINLGAQDFCDWRVFAVPTTYRSSHVAQVYGPDTLGEGQPHDGPSYIFVGANVTDERLARYLPKLNEHYDVSMEQLQQARAGHIVPVRIDRPENWEEPPAYLTAEDVL